MAPSSTYSVIRKKSSSFFNQSLHLASSFSKLGLGHGSTSNESQPLEAPGNDDQTPPPVPPKDEIYLQSRSSAPTLAPARSEADNPTVYRPTTALPRTDTPQDVPPMMPPLSPSGSIVPPPRRYQIYQPVNSKPTLPELGDGTFSQLNFPPEDLLQHLPVHQHQQLFEFMPTQSISSHVESEQYASPEDDAIAAIPTGPSRVSISSSSASRNHMHGLSSASATSLPYRPSTSHLSATDFQISPYHYGASGRSNRLSDLRHVIAERARDGTRKLMRKASMGFQRQSTNFGRSSVLPEDRPATRGGLLGMRRSKSTLMNDTGPSYVTPTDNRPISPAVESRHSREGHDLGRHSYFDPRLGGYFDYPPNVENKGKRALNVFSSWKGKGKFKRPKTALGKNAHDVFGDGESGIGIDYSEGIQERFDVEPEPTGDNSRKDFLPFLPAELVHAIFALLPVQSVLTARRVSRQWSAVASSPPVWRALYVAEFGDPRGGRTARPNRNWQKMYEARTRLARRWEAGKVSPKSLVGHEDSVYCVQFDDHKIITGSRDRTIRIWDPKTGTCLRTLGWGADNHALLELGREGLDFVRDPPPPSPATFRNSVSSVSGSITGAPGPVQWEYHRASVLCLQFDKYILVTGSSDQTCLVWSIPSYRPIKRLHEHTAGVLDICFDDHHLITCSKDTTLAVFSRTSNTAFKMSRRLLGHRGPVNAVQLRGNLCISASGDALIKLWDVTTGDCIRDFRGHSRGLACVQFSQDRRMIVSGGNDQSIRVWDVESGTCLLTLDGHVMLVRTLWLDKSCTRIVSGSYDKSVKVWELKGVAAALEARAKARARQSAFVNSLSNPSDSDANSDTWSQAATPNHDLITAQASTMLLSQSNGDGGDGTSHDASIALTSSSLANNSSSVHTTDPSYPPMSGRMVLDVRKWHDSWILSARADMRRIVSASQDQKAVVLDFASGMEGEQYLEDC